MKSLKMYNEYHLKCEKDTLNGVKSILKIKMFRVQEKCKYKYIFLNNQGKCVFCVHVHISFT